MTEIIADIGINHDGEEWKARQMICDAALAGCKIVKFQCHIPDAEMLPNNIIPSNANETIWEMMKRCSFDANQEMILKHMTERLGMEYLSTPFSREAVDRLEWLGVTRYKIGSGECNNFPLIKYIVSTGKPVILSTGMNDYRTIDQAVDIIGNQLYAILHCVSEYPTPYEHVNLLRMLDLRERYGVPVGLSDHSIGIYTALAAVTLGAEVIEKHFTSNKSWYGADIPISIDPEELYRLILGAGAIEQAMVIREHISAGEIETAKFAYASVVSLCDIKAGEVLTSDNVWVKRPGGGIPAEEYERIVGRRAARDIQRNTQLTWSDVA